KTDEKFEILGLFNGMGKNMVEEIGLSSKGKGQVMDFTKLSSGIYWVRIQKSGSIFVLPIQKGE
ncbi:MAG TPA: hypothetical protein PKY12_15500, partial [Catalimonadaceae bacterium]|nr:hypothetical protein [Catalimonadaceae bacterium]